MGRQLSLGKHSLGTKDREEALSNLERLDRKKAFERGLIKKLEEHPLRQLSIAEGWKLFFEHRGRPQIMGGVSKNTLKRYGSVRDKHISFCKRRDIRYWSLIDKSTTEEFGRWLSRKSADRTLKLELELIVSVVRFLAEEKKLLDRSQPFTLRLSKPEGSDRYCFRREEVMAMVEHCRSTPGLHWFVDVIVGLATTGLRSEEFNGLRWSDIDFEAGVIRLKDQRYSGRKRMLGSIRAIKGKRDRVLPLHPAFRGVLESLPRNRDGLIFHGPRGGRLHARNNLEFLKTQVIKPLADKFPTPSGEIGFEHGVIHSFRHFFCSEAFRGGASEAEVLDWLGDRDSNMIKVYRHLRPDDSKAKMNRIDFLGNGTTNGSI
ncbi:MAG: tyrosine-type recombinase/integrase [Pirellulales bacterium]